MNKKRISPLRLLALIVILANIFFNYAYNNIFGLRSNAEVSDMYSSLFTPAGYAFSIWGLIYLAFIVYGVIQLLPANRNIHLYDRLAIPVILVNFFASVWIFLFVTDRIDIAMGVITLMLFISWIMFRFAREAALGNVLSAWIKFPFSLLFGWLTVAAIANFSIWLVSNTLLPAGQNPLVIIAYIAITLVTTVIVTYVYCDHIYPAVISWAMVAIWAARMNDYPVIAYSALGVAILSQIWSFYVWRKREK
jgi:translocator protein